MSVKKIILFVFNKILKATLGVWLRLTYNIKIDDSQIKGVKTPFILISNHCLNWDPFMTPLPIKKTVHWMSSDNLFRNKLLGFLMSTLVGAFPKKKAVADTSSIKKSIRIIRDSGIVGLFPEGSRTWNGTSIDILFSTAKFVRFLKVPVIMCEQRGGYLSRPRWAIRGRRGKLHLKYYVLIDKEGTKGDVNEIYNKMNDAVKYSEYEYQREHMIEFRSKANAEFLEQYIYICPTCHSIGKLHSVKNAFFCEKCHMATTLDSYGFFKGENKPFEDVSQWGKWQYSFIKKHINENYEIFKDENVVMKSEKRGSKLDKGIKGSLTLYKDKVVFKHENGQFIFENQTIFGNTIQLNWIFEFYYKGVFRRFYFYPKNRVSAYKWDEAINIIKQIGGKINE